MRSWFRRKRRDIRHAVQELRTGDGIDRARSAVRTTIVGGRPPGDDARVEVPMGIERVLRKAAAEERFAQRLLADRAAALDASGLALTPAERAILTATPDDQLRAMIGQLAPTSPRRRSFLKRFAAAAGIALFGAQVMGCRQQEPRVDGVRPDMQGTKGMRSDYPPSPNATEGIRPDMPPVTGIQPDDPSSEPIETETPPDAEVEPYAPSAEGVQTDWPGHPRQEKSPPPKSPDGTLQEPDPSEGTFIIKGARPDEPPATKGE